MRIAFILAISSFLISCASLKLGGEAAPEAPAELPAASEDATQLGFNAEGTSNASAPTEPQSGGESASLEASSSQQNAHDEMEAAAPNGGSDSFAASANLNQTPGMENTPGPEVPTQLPEKTGASWDQKISSNAEAAPDAASNNFILPNRPESTTTYDDPAEEKTAEVSKSTSHKQNKKSAKLSKKEKKSKKSLAKNSKKSKKALAKKSKSQKDCNKIVKSSKKSTKKAIAMCKAEKKKIAQKSKKSRKLASTGSSSIR